VTGVLIVRLVVKQLTITLKLYEAEETFNGKRALTILIVTGCVPISAGKEIEGAFTTY
jgi:uncharacterized transporter YbjL